MRFFNNHFSHTLLLQRTVGIRTYRQYVAAIVDLWAYQRAQGVNSHPNPGKGLVAQLLKSLKKEEEGRKRNEFVDRGIGTFLDGYSSSEEMIKVCSFFMGRKPDVGLRDRLSFLLSHYCLLRGEHARGMELPDLQVLILEEEGVEQRCPALITILKKGKTNQFGR